MIKSLQLRRWIVLGCAVMFSAGNLLAKASDYISISVTSLTPDLGSWDYPKDIGDDSHITTRHTLPGFKVRVEITVNDTTTYRLVAPSLNPFDMTVGETMPWSVKNNETDEEAASGNIILFKVNVVIDGIGEEKEETDGACLTIMTAQMFSITRLPIGTCFRAD